MFALLGSVRIVHPSPPDPGRLERSVAPCSGGSFNPGMVQATLSRDTVQGQTSPANPAVETFRFMLLARVLDEKMASLYRTGKIHGGVFLGRGQEALSAAIGMSLRKGRRICAAGARHGRSPGLWGAGAGLRANLSGLGAGPDAGAGRQCASRTARGGHPPHDQSSGGDDFGGQRHSLRQAGQRDQRCGGRDLSGRRRHLDRGVS